MDKVKMDDWDSPPHSTRKSKDHGSKRGGREKSSRGGGGGRQSLSRSVQISKALSRLLRHAAVEERIPIDANGYVRLDHLLSWRRLKSFQPSVTVEEIVEQVRASDKQRFALKFVSDDSKEKEAVDGEGQVEDGSAPEKAEEVMETETQRALAAYTTLSSSTSGGVVDPTKFFIRATQGHSLALVSTEGLLTPISLSDEKSIPHTVVHGTFYGAWERILRDGALKRMGRNHVHFATGPRLDEVVSRIPANRRGTGTATVATGENEGTGEVEKVLMENKVISGMHTGAQILIYIDIRKALQSSASSRPKTSNRDVDDGKDEEGEERELKWFRSENNVVLTPGLGPDGIVPSEYWNVVLEVKEGLGVIWRAGEGLIKDLPDKLKGRGMPFGKHRGARAGGARGGAKQASRNEERAKGQDEQGDVNKGDKSGYDPYY